MQNWYRNMCSRSVNGLWLCFCFYFEKLKATQKEPRSKAALQVCNGLYAKFTQIEADKAKEERKRARGMRGEDM